MRKWLVLLAAAAAFPVAAQQRPADLQPIPEPPPAPAGMADDPVEPQVTIVRRGEDKVEEYRINGRLYMMKVTPPHGAPYVMIDANGDGHFARQDATDTGLRVPQWIIHTW